MGTFIYHYLSTAYIDYQQTRSKQHIDTDLTEKVLEGLEGGPVLGFEGPALGHEGVDVRRTVIRLTQPLPILNLLQYLQHWEVNLVIKLKLVVSNLEARENHQYCIKELRIENNTIIIIAFTLEDVCILNQGFFFLSKTPHQILANL